MQTTKILGITVSLRSLRESLNYSEYLSGKVPLSTIQYITTRMLIKASQQSEFKQLLENTDMLICAEPDILKAAGINSGARQYEIENNLFFKELCRPIHRNGDGFYLISETPDKLQVLSEMFDDYLGENCKIVTRILDDMKDKDGLINHAVLANEINDFAPRIIISNLSFPYQLQLMNDLKSFLNARIWLGLPSEMTFYKKSKFSLPAFLRIGQKYFKKKVNQYDNNLKNIEN